MGHLPSFLKQSLPRSTDLPVEYETDAIRKQDAIAKPWERVDNTIATSPKEPNEGNKDSDYTTLAGNSIFDMRGFGEFDTTIGAGAKGKAPTKCVWGNSQTTAKTNKSKRI